MKPKVTITISRWQGNKQEVSAQAVECKIAINAKPGWGDLKTYKSVISCIQNFLDGQF